MDWKEIIEGWMARKGLTRYRLSRQSDVPQSSFARWCSKERGLPEPESVYRIANGLGLDAAERAEYFAAVIEAITAPYRVAAERPPMVLAWQWVETEPKGDGDEARTLGTITTVDSGPATGHPATH